MREAPTYLTQFPISIRKKKHSKASYIDGSLRHYKSEHCTDFQTKYGYFAVNKAGNINFIITLNDKRRHANYTIKIAKSHIYESLLLSLMYRPVRRNKEQRKNFYVHRNIEPLMPIEAMNDLLPFEIKERYEKAKGQMKGIIKTDLLSDVSKRTAELQLQRLLEQQWKMELLYEIYETEIKADKIMEEEGLQWKK